MGRRLGTSFAGAVRQRTCAVKHFRTAGAFPSVRSFGVLDSRRPTACLQIRHAAH